MEQHPPTKTFDCIQCLQSFDQSYKRTRHKCQKIPQLNVNQNELESHDVREKQMNLSQDTLKHPLTRSNLGGSTSANTSPERKTLTGESIHSANQFNMNTCKENAELKKEVQMLRQQIKTLQQQQIKLEEKLESKDGELVKLNGDIFKFGGELSAANMLQKLLKEKEAENYQLKQEVTRLQKGSPINLHKQCEALELELRQQLKESEELSQAIFNRLNQRIEELKDKLKKLEGEEFEEADLHMRKGPQMQCQDETITESEQKKTEQSDMDMTDKQKINQERTQLGGTQCIYCACITSKTLGEHWKCCYLKIRFNYVVYSYGKQWKQILTDDSQQQDHISEHPKYKEMFTEFMSGLSGDELKSVQELQEDLLKANNNINCNSNNGKGKKFDDNSSSSSDVSMIDTTQHNYQTQVPAITIIGPVGLADGSTVYGTNTTRSNLKNQRLPTRNEYNLFDAALEQPGLYRSRWSDLRKEGEKVYINPQSVYQQVNLMNLKRRAKSTSLDRAASRQAKRDNGVPLTLEECRAEQEATIKEQFQGSKDVTLKTENWLKSLGQCQSNDDFQKLGDPICDAIILPEVPLIFGTGEDRFTKMKVFLLDFKVPVKYVGKAVRDGCVFIQLQDHDNKFTVELLEKLRAALDALRKDVKAAFRKQKKTKEECIEEEIEDIYIKQIDYTQDLIGFFMSLTSNIFDDLRDFSKLLNMEYSRDYTQLRTSFQFEEKCLLDSGKLITINRLKIYNKLVHLWTSGQFKKWLNMNTHKIFNADQAFYFDKILPGMVEGLSRIEHSLYFHNKADQDEMLFDAKQNFTKKLIDPVVAALNKMKNKFRYSIPFPTFVESYFKAAVTKSVLISFEEDLWAVAYSYSERAYCFTGHLVNRTKHSGTMLDFIKRYVPEGANMRIFIRGKVYDNIKKRGNFLQLPISSLNAQHNEQYNFKLSSNYKYYLSKDDIKSIQVECDDEELLKILGIDKQAPMSKRELKKQEKEKKVNGGILVEHLVEQKRDKTFKRYYVYKVPSQQICKFYSEDVRGRTYRCEHCAAKLERRGQGKGQLWLA